jgi:hypothetical protein
MERSRSKAFLESSSNSGVHAKPRSDARYTKPIPQSVKDAVEALDREIRQTPSGKRDDRRKR